LEAFRVAKRLQYNKRCAACKRFFYAEDLLLCALAVAIPRHREWNEAG
jgi:rRNA maturation endonuclease Nob1